jgi:hypothetical protein
MTTAYTLIVRLSSPQPPTSNWLNELKQALLESPEIVGAAVNTISSFGLKANELIISISLAFATSVAANLATHALKHTLLSSGQNVQAEIRGGRLNSDRPISGISA